MAELFFLDDERAKDPAVAGAKAATLARLRRRGLPVPDGFVLPAGASLDPARIDAALARLRGALAVRSSSTAEDLEGASFAGQYRTVLGVQGADAVVRAAQVCRDSAPAALAYARALGTPVGRMAVLVQALVEPVVAGVAFSRHPRDASRVLIEAVRGRGDRLMSGEASPDRYEIDRQSAALVAGPTGGSLDGPARDSVMALLRRVEDEMGMAQDVEWAIGPGPLPGALVLLQARPITIGDEAPDPRLSRLTRANIGEVLPGPVTPLTFSTVGAFLEHGFRFVLAGASLLPRDAPPVVVRHRERLYLNLTLAIGVAARLPLVSAADAERLILGTGATAGGRPKPLGLAGLRSGLCLLRLGASKARLVAEAERLVAGLPSPERIAAASPPILLPFLESWAQVGRQVAVAHILSSGASATSLALLHRLLGALSPGDPAARVARLTAGLEGVASAAPTIALEELALRAKDHEAWRAWLREASERDHHHQSGRTDGDPLASAPADLRLELREFLARFGHRALGEGELLALAWEDDPSPVVAALLGLLTSGERSGRARRAKVEARRAEEEALLGPLSPLARALLRHAFLRAQGGVREREHTKSLTVAVAGHGRRLVRAAARCLVAAGRLAQPEDVFFLEWAELVGALRDGETPRPALLARRKRRHTREGALDAPREVDLRPRAEGPLSTGDAALSAGPDTGDAAGAKALVLRGIGVSPGTGRGPVRHLRPGEPHRLQPGDVLVAPVLDAALGPLLASAAGALAEMGGVLSHGSVVARELGVPCVVDVRGALSAFREGEVVTVDGDRGLVSRAGDASEGRPASSSEASPPQRSAEDEAGETFRDFEQRDARESVYFNAIDEASGLGLVATLGVRGRDRGECVIALSLPEGRVLFGLDRAPARKTSRAMEVAGAGTDLGPVRLRARTRLAAHEAAAFPPGPLPLLLIPRTVEVELDLVFHPTGPAIDFCRELAPSDRAAVTPMGDHHLEQSGRFVGRVRTEDRTYEIEASGSRDHSWGRREWAALDYSRLFVARFGDDLALQAVSLAVNGQPVEGGFLWRDGRARRVTRILYAVERREGTPRAVEVEVRTADGEPFVLRGRVERTMVVPVEVERRPWRHLGGRPYALLLQENFVRWEAEGRVGHGVAELSVRP